MLGRVVDRETLPQLTAHPGSEGLDEGFLAVRVEVVDDHMDRLGFAMALRDELECLGKPWRLSIRRGVRVVASDFGLRNTEDVRRSEPNVFVVAPRDPAGPHRDPQSSAAMQLDRPLVEADDRFALVRRLGQCVEHILHAADVFSVQLRDAPHFFPATASTRGSRALAESFLSQRLRRRRACWLRSPEARSSSVSVPPVAGRRPSRRRRPAAGRRASWRVSGVAPRSAPPPVRAPGTANPRDALRVDTSRRRWPCPSGSSLGRAIRESESDATGARRFAAVLSFWPSARGGPLSTMTIRETFPVSLCERSRMTTDHFLRPGATSAQIDAPRSEH